MGEFYEVSERERAKNTDRYKRCSVLKDLDTGEVLLSTREVKEIPEHPNDKFHRVHSNEVGRLDLIAYQYYNNALLYWVIAQANEIYNPFVKLAPGTLIRIPALETLYGNKGILL